MSEEIIKVLDALSDKFGIVIDWTKDNVVPYVEELLIKLQHYLLVMDIVGFILSIAEIVLSVLVAKKLIKCKGKSDIDDLSDCEFGFMIMGIFVFIVMLIAGIAGLFVNGSNLIQFITFPELRILQYLQDLIPE